MIMQEVRRRLQPALHAPAAPMTHLGLGLIPLLGLSISLFAVFALPGQSAHPPPDSRFSWVAHALLLAVWRC